ncbi:hypothetical protein ILUMI_03602 [Ignelater luminosus]|uniref:MADF domain-containing protein n=1 Tax=Ignelater luminosus TaxID=2038154 RepID=A0A8K0DE82_IGNLU|nr:hypothetical protein ILUMI_03602 [Ignelater luminosus]
MKQTENEENLILEMVDNGLTTNVRRAHVPRMTVWKTLKRHDLYPFHVEPVQALLSEDFNKRRALYDLQIKQITEKYIGRSAAAAGLPALWKVKSKAFGNRKEKSKAYEKLVNYYKKAAEEEATVDTVKKKINNIRRAFRKKVIKSKRTGDEYDVVGCNVAHKLRRMNANQREYAEQLISNILFNGIQNKLNNSVHVSHGVPSIYQNQSFTITLSNSSNFPSVYNNELKTPYCSLIPHSSAVPNHSGMSSTGGNHSTTLLEEFIQFKNLEESTNSRGENVVNVVVGILDEYHYSKPWLIKSGVIEKTNYAIVARFANEALAFVYSPEPVQQDKVILLLTDGASYILKAGESLKIFYPNLLQLCAWHTAPLRVAVFKEMCPEIPLPPEPIVTR